jgi:hypothetical protein
MVGFKGEAKSPQSQRVSGKCMGRNQISYPKEKKNWNQRAGRRIASGEIYREIILTIIQKKDEKNLNLCARKRISPGH